METLEIIKALPEDGVSGEGYAIQLSDSSWSWKSKEEFEAEYLPVLHMATPPEKK